MRKFKVVLFFTVFICLMSINAYAEDITATINKEQTRVDITGNLGDEAEVITTVAVYNTTPSFDLSKPDLFYTVPTKANGKIETYFTIPESFDDSGIYKVLLANENAAGEAIFRYVTEGGTKYVMEIINGKETWEEIAGGIKSEYINLAVEENLDENVVEYCAKYFLALRPEADYTDTSLFMLDFNSCLAGAFIKNGSDVFWVLDKYKEKIGIKLADYTSLSNEVKPVFEDCVKNADFKADYIHNQLDELKVLACFKASKTWTKAKYAILGINEKGETINNNFTILNPEKEYYEMIVNKNNFFTELFGMKESINSFDDLKRNFEELAYSTYEEENENSGSSNTPSPGRDSNSSGRSNITISPSEIPSTNTAVLNDISGHWAEKNILKMHQKKIISGYPDGGFKPDNSITRAEFVKLVCGVFDLNNTSAEIDFTDVNANDWYFSYVKSAVANNIVFGVSESEFAPNNNITRQDACVILYRCLENTLEGETDKVLFKDNDEISEYAKVAVSVMKSKGIINGYEDGAFYPNDFLSRAQAATLFASIMDYSYNL